MNPPSCFDAGGHRSDRDVVNRLTREYGLKHELDGGWAVRPLDLAREHGRTILVLESPEGEPLDHLIGPPMEVGKYLRLATTCAPNT